MRQRLFGGVRLLGEGPSLPNVAKLDALAWPMVHQMAKTGMRVDPDHFAKMAVILTRDMERYTEKVRDLTGYYVNLGSGDQVSDLLFKKLGIKQAKVKLTKSGARESVENEVLVSLQHEHQSVSTILDYKEADKLRGTYALPLQKLAKKVGHAHYRVFQNFTTTRIPSGRFACKDPNLLAMPNRTVRGRDLLRGFITDPGWVYLSVDESQIEPRTVAHRSQDPALVRVYENEEDIYSDYATGAFRLPDKRFRDNDGWHYPGIDKKRHRFPAKTCVLAAIYRVTAVGLLEQMPVVCSTCETEASSHDEGCPGFKSLWNEDNCQDLINSFYTRYPGITRMQKADDARARRYGYVWDDWGRLYHMAAVRSVHEWVVSAALREGGNFPIQSFAGGTLKLAMGEAYGIAEELRAVGNAIRFLLPIHDEILSEVRNDYAQEMGEMISAVFQHCVQLRVPIKAEYATAERWGDLVK